MTTPDAAYRGVLADALRATHADADDLTALVTRTLVHPGRALPVAPAGDRSTWAAGGTADATTLDDIVARATADLAAPWPLPRASAAARVYDDGDRDTWERAAFARQRRLSRAALAAAVTLEDSWLAEVLDGVWQLCEQSSWCWPAHDDVFAERGAVLATVADPFVDLGAGEVVVQLAWIDQLLGGVLEERYPGTRARLRHEARARIFDPFVSRRDWHWIGLDGDVHNWNPWIHGNVLVAALRLLDQPGDAELRVRIVALCIEGLDRYLTSLPLDGAIDEGYAYWWNGACRALEALDLLRHATAGAIDAASVPALRATVAFPHRMHLGGPWYLNLADGQARPPAAQPWHALHRAARWMDDADAAAHAAAHRVPGGPVADETEGFGRLLRALTDPAWIAAEPAASPLPRDVWLESTQVLLARERGGTASGLAVAAKGGHNGEHHNHNDVGSFVVAVDGVPVIVDAGRPTYTKQTFGPGRYDIWTMQSGWHNVPVIAGAEQSPGAAFAASGVSTDVSDASSTLSLDLAGAYPSGAPAWRRTVRLDRDAGRVEVHDAWASALPRSEVRMLLAGDVSLADGTAVVRPVGGGRSLRISWPAGVEAHLSVRDLADPMLSGVWGSRLTRLELDVSDRSHLTVTAELAQSAAEGDA